MARNVEECSSIIEKSKKKGVQLTLVHNQLFFPSVRLLRQMVDRGEYDVSSLRTSYKVCQENNQSPEWVFKPKEKGVLWEFGYHLSYLQLEFLRDIEEIYAIARKVKYPVHDKIGVLLKSSKQNYGIIEISMISKRSEILIEMDCKRGKSVRLDLMTDSFTELPEKQQNRGNQLLEFSERILRNVFLSRTGTTGLGYSSGHYYLIKSHLQSLKNGTPPPVPPESGRRAIELLSSIEEQISKNEKDS